MTPRKHTIVRDMDPELVHAEYTTEFPEEADELLEMAHARVPTYIHVPLQLNHKIDKSEKPEDRNNDQ